MLSYIFYKAPPGMHVLYIFSMGGPVWKENAPNPAHIRRTTRYFIENLNE